MHLDRVGGLGGTLFERTWLRAIAGPSLRGNAPADRAIEGGTPPSGSQLVVVRDARRGLTQWPPRSKPQP